MKSLSKKRDELFGDILKNFFKQQEVTEFSKRYSKSGNPSGLKNSSRKNLEQVNLEINTYHQIQSQIDLLITYAENKLSKGKFLELLLQLGQFTITSGELSSAVYIHEKILSQTGDNASLRHISAYANLALGDVYSRQALWQTSFEHIKKANNLFIKLNDSRGRAECENMLGTIYGEWGNLKLAREHLEKSLSLLEKNKDISLIGKIEINLGIISNIVGDLESAISYYRRALVNFEKLEDLNRIAEIRHNMGMMFTKRKEFRTAITEFERSIATSLKAGYLPSLGISYLSKAYIYSKLKNHALADAFADKALEICHKTNDKLSIADIYKIKGIVQRNKGKVAKAKDYLMTSLRINKELKNELNEAETAYELGLLHKDLKNSKDSRKYFQQALAYYKNINAKEEIVEIENQLSGR